MIVENLFESHPKFLVFLFHPFKKTKVEYNQDMVNILQYGSPETDAILRTPAKTVASNEIGTDRLHKIITDLKTALASQNDGVAIAAPQIGIHERIFIISGKVLKTADPKKYANLSDTIVCINPRITKRSKETQVMEEGCLSVRWLYGKVRRAKRVTLEATDETGKKFERGASGLLSQIIQHEYDHLDGILFIDKAFDLEEIPPTDAAHAGHNHPNSI